MTDLIPCLWFDGQAEQAAKFYAGLIPDSQVLEIVRSPADYPPGGSQGDVLQVKFTLFGKRFVGLNGGPDHPFTEAVSFQLMCEDQTELDGYWDVLSAHPQSEQCGWVRDKYGLFWQIIPRRLPELLSDPDPERAKRAMQAMMSMKKIDIEAIEAAAAG